MTTTDPKYNDEYPTCASTCVTLRIYPNNPDLELISRALAIQPSRVSGPTPNRPADKPGWFLSSKGSVTSKDTRRHIDWLVAILEPRAEALRSLREATAKMDVSCYWLSAFGNGGPVLSVLQMVNLSNLGLDCEFDVYAAGDHGAAV